MLPTGLNPVDISILKEGSMALVIEIGGTNFYGAQVVIRNGIPCIHDSNQSLLPRKHIF